MKTRFFAVSDSALSVLPAGTDLHYSISYARYQMNELAQRGKVAFLYVVEGLNADGVKISLVGNAECPEVSIKLRNEIATSYTKLSTLIAHRPKVEVLAPSGTIYTLSEMYSMPDINEEQESEFKESLLWETVTMVGAVDITKVGHARKAAFFETMPKLDRSFLSNQLQKEKLADAFMATLELINSIIEKAQSDDN